MALVYDLHTHSTASDGTLVPAELVRRAWERGVRVLALTDHDTTEGIAEARAEAAQLGMELFAGVEISVTWGGIAVHILGLGVDPEQPELAAGLGGLLRYREWRAQEIGRKLEKQGIAGAYEGAKAFSNGKLIGRTHFARFLVEAGHAEDTRKVFQRFLTRGKPGYVRGEWAKLEDAIGWIRAAGGQAVVAHPARYDLTRTHLRRLFREFADAGGAALEVVSGSHSRDDCVTMARHAADFDLLGSAGSDYHGPENPWIELGGCAELPPGVKPIWGGWR